MTDDLESLIDDLGLWTSSDYGRDRRNRAMAALKRRAPEAVPALIARLGPLVAERVEHLRRVDAVLRTWRLWYDESDRLTADHGLTADVERYRKIPTSTLPEPPVQLEDTSLLKVGIIEALHQIGDERSGPVLLSALTDPQCIGRSSAALCDIRIERATPPLLGAAARSKPKKEDFTAVVKALRVYRVSAAQARERFAAERTPEGRVSLWHVVNKLAETADERLDVTEIRDSLVYMAMADPPERWDAMTQLSEAGVLGGGTDRDPWNHGYETPPSPEIIKAAISMAARDKPDGFGHELRFRVRQIVKSDRGLDTRTAGASAAPDASSFAASEGVLALLAEQAPVPSVDELHFALELALFLAMRDDLVRDPLELIRSLQRLSAHPAPEVSARALKALHNGWMLFEQMEQKDAARREEARMVFEKTARPGDRERYATFLDMRRPKWHKILWPFKRRA